MNGKIKAKVIEQLLDKFLISFDDKLEVALIRKNAKKNKVIVGDNVIVSKIGQDFVIENILDRKNELIRPKVSNIDMLVIVTSIENPKPDFLLLDKQILLCYQKNITPLICVNKCDYIDSSSDAKKIQEYIENVYVKLGFNVVFTSAKNNIGIDILKEKIKGKTVAFSGNSGVGKSSITKCYIKDKKIETNEIARKTKRGRHTTKSAVIYKLEDDTFILDTPGFSSYELFDFNPKDLKKYYADFNDSFCDFDDCNHVLEKENVCDVKRNLKNGNIDKGRYDRYVYIYNTLKEAYDKRYK